MIREEHPYGLGNSDTAQRYAIQSLAEAQAYLAHPVLAGRLRECCQILLDLKTCSALDVFGTPDDLKLRSSMTLFGGASAPGSMFDAVLQKYFGGEKDLRTAQLLGQLAGWRNGLVLQQPGGPPEHRRRADRIVEVLVF